VSLAQLDAYRDVAPRGTIDLLQRLGERVRGRRFLHVSPSRFGAGSAEILHRAVPLLRDLGVETGWEVIVGNPDFYAAVARLEQNLAIPRDGRLKCLPEPSPKAVLLRSLLRQLDSRPIGEAGQGLAKVDPVTAHQEGEDVAALSAAEAMPRLPIRGHDEGGCLLGVERAETLVRGAGPLELHGLADDINDGEFRLDLGGEA